MNALALSDPNRLYWTAVCVAALAGFFRDWARDPAQSGEATLWLERADQLDGWANELMPRSGGPPC
jgi:hypothetical protein